MVAIWILFVLSGPFWNCPPFWNLLDHNYIQISLRKVSCFNQKLCSNFLNILGYYVILIYIYIDKHINVCNLSFQDMIQENNQTGKKRLVTRRPDRYVIDYYQCHHEISHICKVHVRHVYKQCIYMQITCKACLLKKDIYAKYM